MRGCKRHVFLSTYPVADRVLYCLLLFRPVHVCLCCSMLGASAGWVLPYSYQCNLMVMAAGKYRTADFIKIGLPYHVSTEPVLAPPACRLLAMVEIVLAYGTIN